MDRDTNDELVANWLTSVLIEARLIIRRVNQQDFPNILWRLKELFNDEDVPSWGVVIEVKNLMASIAASEWRMYVNRHHLQTELVSRMARIRNVILQHKEPERLGTSSDD